MNMNYVYEQIMIKHKKNPEWSMFDDTGEDFNE